MSDLLSGISNLTKQISNNIPYQIKKLGESVHTMVMNYTEAENLVYEATNEDPWGPTGPQMKEIANYTFQYEGFHQVMNLLWKRMLEDNKTAWRRVYKSLTLLNHLLLHGSERVIGSARDHTFQMRALEQYKYVDDRGRDQGLNVRHRVKLILDLLGDDDKLRTQRKKVKSDNKDRYQGYTSEDIRMGRGGSFNGSSSYGYSDDWKDDSNRSYNRKSSFEENRDDYATKEVNSFQFPEEGRRGSVSPELGFRQDPVEDDDFGDFATARSVSQTTTPQKPAATRAGAANIPVLRPPGSAPSAATATKTTSSASFDLLGLDTSSSVMGATPQVKPMDAFGANYNSFTPPIASLNLASPSSAVEKSTPADLISTTDLFAATSSSSKSFADPFPADWAFAPPAPNAGTPSAVSPQSDIQSSTAFISPTPAFPANKPQTANADDIFGSFAAPLKPNRLSTTESPSKPATPTNGASPSITKIGSTWAGATGLIDLDNLAAKSTPTKQGPTLNQMQMSKHNAGI